MKHGVCFTIKCRSFLAFSILLLGFSLVSSSPLFSQGSSGRILGTVTDSNGGAISGATVTVLDVARGTTRTLVTDDTGAYSAPNLLTGQYKIRAEFKGFKTTERQNVVLEVAQELRVDLALQPGEQAQTITVTEDMPLINTTNAELGGTIQNEVINDLPLNGRNFENLLDLRPGVTKYVGNSGWTQSSNGLRPHDNFFLVEGVNSNDPWMAQSMMNAVMAAGDAGTMLPIDAIDEFKTQQNPRAEFGWKPGAVVNVGVKSGTNTIHGSAYAYGRTTGWDARNYFNTDIKGNPGCATDPVPCIKTPVELEQWGASVGGPVFKDKLFYFGNFETQHYAVGNPITHTVPDTSATGVGTKSLVGACQAVPQANRAALSLHLAGLDTNCVMAGGPGVFPVSNGSTQLTTSLNSVDRIYSGVGKIDYHLNDKNSLSGMFFMSPGQGAFVDDPGHQVTAGQETTQYARSIVGTVGWNYIPNSSWVNSARFGLSHYYQTFISGDHTVDPSTLGFFTGVTNPASFGFPRLRISGFGSFQLGASWPKTVGPDSVWQFTDSVSYLHGNHAFKFGGEVLINQSTNIVTNNTKGPVNFSSLTNFFSGTIKSANITVGDFKRNLQAEGYAAFLQDDWRVTQRLTLNLGVRYELNTVMHEKNNLIGNFDPNVGLIQDGVGGVKGVYNGDHNNFSPRVGFAWDIAGNGKTVVRGGGGILYEQGSFDAFNALGNLLGLRTVPTGVSIYTCSDNTNPCDAPNPVTTAGGTINLGSVSYSGGNGGVAGLNARWRNNSAANPLYAAAPACGDGSVAAASGITANPCDVLGVDRKLRTPYVETWSLGIQRALTNSLSLEVSYVGNHASKLLGLSDLNQPPIGAGWTNAVTTLCAAAPDPSLGNCAPDGNAEVLAQPFHSKFPYLGYIYFLSNNNISNYHSLQVSVTQHETHGFSYVLGYTYSHALAESPDNWSFISPINSANPREIYGTTEFDVRHRFTFSTTYNVPGFNAPAQLLKGWSINSIITLESPTPWGINDITTDFSGTNEINGQSPNGEQWNFFGNPNDFTTTKALINTNGGTGGLPYYLAGTPGPGDNAADFAINHASCTAHAGAPGTLSYASLINLGCYTSLNDKSVLLPPAFGSLGTTAPNMFRSFPYYNVDLNITKSFKFNERISAQFRAEFFNIFNRPEIANVFGGPGGDNSFTDPTADAGASFGFRNTTPDVLSSNPVLGSGGARAMQLGLKILF